jgi:hypothetical protein
MPCIAGSVAFALSGFAMRLYTLVPGLQNFEDFVASRPDEFTFQWHMGLLDANMPGYSGVAQH